MSRTSSGARQRAARIKARICARTGLELEPARGQITWRVAESKFGALNPRVADAVRPDANPDSWRRWNRWDVPARRTVYTATSAKVSFAEVLSPHKQHPANRSRRLDLSQYLDDIADANDGMRLVRQEWQGAHHMTPYTLPASWRDERLLHRVHAPNEGWYVSITSMQSMGTIAEHLGAQLGLLGVNEVDLSLLAGNRREITCLIAEWVHGLVLDDGSLPHGIVYPSRHDGTALCYATWLRRIDDGLDASTELIASGPGHPIPCDHPDLVEVQRAFGIRGF